MPRILVVGYNPDTVDLDDPALPPGLDRDKLWAGVNTSLKRITDHGWEGVQCMVEPDETAPATVKTALAEAQYDCIVIGGGVRLSHKSVAVFEAIIDAIRKAAPNTPIAFNVGPETSLEAAKRWVKDA